MWGRLFQVKERSRKNKKAAFLFVLLKPKGLETEPRRAGGGGAGMQDTERGRAAAFLFLGQVPLIFDVRYSLARCGALRLRLRAARLEINRSKMQYLKCSCGKAFVLFICLKTV